MDFKQEKHLASLQGEICFAIREVLSTELHTDAQNMSG